VKKFLLVPLAIILLSGLVFGCAEPAPPAPAPPAPTVPAPAAPAPAAAPTGKVHEWTFIECAPLIAQPWERPALDAIEEATGGRIKITILEAGQHPFFFPDLVSALRERQGFEMCRQMPWVSMSALPLSGLLELPFILPHPGEFADLMEDPNMEDVRHTIYEGLLDEWNTVPIVYFQSVNYGIGTKDRLVTSLESLKGLKIRAAGGEQSEMISLLQAVPVTIPVGEVTTALQRGTVDGWTTAIDAAINFGWTAMAPYITHANYVSGMHYFGVNKDAWNELSPDLQDAVMKAMAQEKPKLQKYFDEEWGITLVQRMAKEGLVIGAMPSTLAESLREMCRPIWDEWAKRVGPPAAELVERVDAFHNQWVKSQ